MTASVDWAGSPLSASCPSTAGTSSGEISVSTIDCRVSLASAPNSPRSTSQRIRCWIRVFGTDEFTL